ncbi:hypothetical protein ASPVEDRAFT_40254 [Aspergillus versicolor CBS 583.65]|uniref:Major facilitator superfamily (MFS) profile domain-containing protein n=1 Tax=Aspergillus versicolor CBS 583.65 TaxID=1036611 RepID=A0A1L9PGS3_ASPVE|nr:uncharacterized protein ASPVEDRAFT_40254 [Aspergillus versicolor CBS 583.65]OJJ00719.1 hypothetical protein ASPVEDRAFT_40254 [Aspergillus versicolor CBS 583.65]
MEKSHSAGEAPDLQKEGIFPVTKQGTNGVDLGEVLELELDPKEASRVRWKLDLILLPLMCFAYFLQFVDKLILSQATLFNLREDLNLQGNQYSWTSAVFYFGYLSWSWPSSYLLVRLPIGKYLGTTIFLWGGILMCHAASKNFAGLMTARFFLGVGEAAVAPGFSLIVGMFYTRKEQPLRQSLWYFGNCLGALLGGLIGYGIGHINAPGVNRWQLLFLILGAITSAFGIVVFALLPDSPAHAIFLTKAERTIALRRTLENKTGVMDTREFRWDQARQAVADPQTWFLVLFTVCVNFANGGLTSFLAILINGFGFGTFQSLLLQMPSGGVEIITLIITSTVATLVRSTRIAMLVCCTAVSVVGMAMVWKIDPEEKAARLVGLSLGIAYAMNIPISMSLMSSNVASFTKRSVVSAMIFMAYCVGNIVGPQFFIESEAPSYPTGIKASMSGLVLGIFWLGCLFAYYAWENKRRDRVHGRPSDISTVDEMQDELSNKTDREIPSFRYVL